MAEDRRRHDDLLELVGELRATTAVVVAQLADWRAENGRLQGAADKRLEQVERDVRELRDWRWRTVGVCVGVSTFLSILLGTAGLLAGFHH